MAGWDDIISDEDKKKLAGTMGLTGNGASGSWDADPSAPTQAALDPSLFDQPSQDDGVGSQQVAQLRLPAATSNPDSGIDPEFFQSPQPSPLKPAPLPPGQDQDPVDLSPGAGIAPNVQDYIAKKFNLGDYSDDARKKIQDGGSPIAEGVAGILASLGAGFQGKDATAAGLNQLKSADDFKKQKLDAFDKARANKIQESELAKQAAQEDPNSEESKRFRSTLKSNFPKIAEAYGDKFDSLTASDQKNVLQVAETKAKLDEAHATAQMRAEMQRDRQDEKKSKTASENDNKDAMKLEETLKKGWTARSGVAGKVQQKISDAEAAQALLEQAKTQKGGLDSRQSEELAQATARLIGGGGAAASARVNALVPHTAWGNLQSMKEYLSNNPTGQGMQDFTKRLADTIDREKNVALDQKRQFQVESLAAHDRLRNSNPDLYNRILQSNEIDPSMIDDKGRYKKAAPESKGPAEVERKTKDGRIGIFNPDTKEFIRWK